MDSSMNERMPTYLHVPFCCCVLSLKIFPIFPVGTFDVLWRYHDHFICGSEFN